MPLSDSLRKKQIFHFVGAVRPIRNRIGHKRAVPSVEWVTVCGGSSIGYGGMRYCLWPGAPLLYPNTPPRNMINERRPLYLDHQIECLNMTSLDSVYPDCFHAAHDGPYINPSNCLSRLIIERTMRTTKTLHGRLECARSIGAKKSPSLYSVELSLE